MEPRPGKLHSYLREDHQVGEMKTPVCFERTPPVQEG